MILSRRILKLGLWLALVVGLLLGWLGRNALYDWWRLRDYHPPAVIKQLAVDSTMTEPARHLFYINHPQLIASKTKFRQACTQTEQTIVLGCYHGPQRGIDLFDVKDSRLGGVEQVTAAHEMLHAAYDRLSGSDRKQVDSWLSSYYQDQLTNKRVIKTIASYKKTEPDDISNEMHSIFATEITDLPAPLENYYGRYFKDRSKVVGYSQRYEAAFESRQAEADTLLSRLKALEVQIRSLEADLYSQKQGLEADRGAVHSQTQAAAYNQRVRAYNAQIQQLNGLIAEYERLRLRYNDLVLQQQALYKAIDTRDLKAEPTQ